MKALVVDDSAAVRSYLRKILSAIGFDVIEAGNGREGMDRLRGNTPVNLVLLDWSMPEVDGMELLSRMRCDPIFNDVSIMMVTTERETSEISSALNLGANEYVMKPFTPEIIQQKLQLLGFAVPQG